MESPVTLGRQRVRLARVRAERGSGRDGGAALTTQEHGRGPRRGERRLPMALAVFAAAVLSLLLPSEFRVWEPLRVLYPAFILVLLGILVLGDPGRIDRDRRWLRVTTAMMVGAITAATAFSALRLVVGILTGATFVSPGQLLACGAIVWSTAIIAFALWYWLLDSGGPAARADGSAPGGRPAPAFRFPEQDIPDERYAEWYPQFVDYLAVSFNTSTAFSPTDVSAVRHWSKLWLIAQSAMSLALLVLVVARAVNVL